MPGTASSLPMRLAVLPFRQLAPDPETEFLTFSLADAIASSLSGLESLIVRSPIAAARFASDVPDLAAIGAALDVSLVLVGAVLRAGDRVRVSAQLVEAPRGTLLWTTTAETSLDDMFRVLDGLVRRIVESLALPLTVREARGLDHDVPGERPRLRAVFAGEPAGTLSGDMAAGARSLSGVGPRRSAVCPGVGAARTDLPDDGEIRGGCRSAAGAARGRIVPSRAGHQSRAVARALSVCAARNGDRPIAVEAFVRLLDRARERRADPQLFAGLVQACRYVGLLEASRAAHERARRLDPTIKTSVAYTSAIVGDYARAADEARENDDPFEGIALALAGRTEDAIGMLLDLQRRYGSNQVWAAYIDLMQAFTRGTTEDDRGSGGRVSAPPVWRSGRTVLHLRRARSSPRAGARARGPATNRRRGLLLSRRTRW